MKQSLIFLELLLNHEADKNCISLLRDIKGTISFYVSYWAHYKSVRIFNEIKVDRTKNTN
jgi:hypothetical protein